MPAFVRRVRLFGFVRLGLPPIGILVTKINLTGGGMVTGHHTQATHRLATSAVSILSPMDVQFTSLFLYFLTKLLIVQIQ